MVRFLKMLKISAILLVLAVGGLTLAPDAHAAASCKSLDVKAVLMEQDDIRGGRFRFKIKLQPFDEEQASLIAPLVFVRLGYTYTCCGGMSGTSGVFAQVSSDWGTHTIVQWVLGFAGSIDDFWIEDAHCGLKG